MLFAICDSSYRLNAGVSVGGSAFIPGSHLARGSPALHPMLGDGFSHEGQVRP
eukprot:COSAG04_NODE_2916_length_3388_cov_1.855275_1_plen_53_part_00